ncbi:MFS transporter [Nonomuraea recticatena]|uniref:MFS transporter n=1 Tax=Nonomuraea recticatena TaxID=46178 RepID=UPI00361483C8
MSVGVVMPAISEELDALNLYGMSFSAFLIGGLFANVVAGLWSDRKGYGLPFIAGITLFVIGMALAGAALNKELFVLARVVQGLGGGSTIVAIYVMIARVYAPEARGRIFAAISAAWVVPAMVGPAVAGLVADTVGWRWVFYGICPLIVPALLMLLPALRQSSRGTPSRARGLCPASWPRPPRRAERPCCCSGWTACTPRPSRAPSPPWAAWRCSSWACPGCCPRGRSGSPGACPPRS